LIKHQNKYRQGDAQKCASIHRQYLSEPDRSRRDSKGDSDLSFLLQGIVP
jgi:hypothetical protein